MINKVGSRSVRGFLVRFFKVRLCSSGAHGALHAHRAAFVRRLPCVEACIKRREIRCVKHIKRLNLLIIDVMLQAAEASTVGAHQHRAGRHSVFK